MNLKSLFIILFFPLSAFSQTTLTKAQVQEDFTIFKDILEKGHPGLFEYTSKSQWDSIFKAFEQTEVAKIHNPEALFKSLSSLAEHVKDGHLQVLHHEMDTVPNMFPLLLKIIDGKLYTDTDDFGIPVGSEIKMINGESAQEIIKKLLKFVPSDGYNLTRKYRQIEKEFGILHYYEFGYFNEYDVQYLTPDQRLKTTEIESKPFESIGKRFPLRNSHFALYHSFENRKDYFMKKIAEKEPFTYYIDSLNTAVLTVNSFGLDPQKFKSDLVDIFKAIKKKKCTNLIVDIRQNIGGYRINAINLFSFLTNEPFTQRISESAVTDVIPRKEYVIHTMSDYNAFFEKYFESVHKENEQWVLESDHAQNEMQPYKKPFKGNIYVLIGGNTFSAASTFALNAKNSNHITLVGEETGGGYYFHTGQFPVVYQLPNSKIMLRLSLVKINHDVKDHTIPKGSGVLPDIEVPLSVEDLIAGRDSQLDYILNLINEQ